MRRAGSCSVWYFGIPHDADDLQVAPPLAPADADDAVRADRRLGKNRRTSDSLTMTTRALSAVSVFAKSRPRTTPRPSVWK